MDEQLIESTLHVVKLLYLGLLWIKEWLCWMGNEKLETSVYKYKGKCYKTSGWSALKMIPTLLYM